MVVAYIYIMVFVQVAFSFAKSEKERVPSTQPKAFPSDEAKEQFYFDAQVQLCVSRLCFFSNMRDRKQGGQRMFRSRANKYLRFQKKIISDHFRK